MKTYKELLKETQEHTSAETSLNQVSAGINHAVSHNLIKPNSVNVDYGGGKYDKAKKHVENSVKGAKLHVHDRFNRSSEHNENIDKLATNNADYVGLHNVLNVIKEPEERKSALENMKKFLKPETGVGHITVYTGDKSGNGRITKKDKGKGSSWQNHRPTSSYVDEVKNVFPNHSVELKGEHIFVKNK